MDKPSAPAAYAALTTSALVWGGFDRWTETGTRVHFQPSDICCVASVRW